MSLLGSTYICEQISSHTKQAKNKMRRKILDEHLENTLLHCHYLYQIRYGWTENKLSFLIKNWYKYIFLVNVLFHYKKLFVNNVLVNNISHIELITNIFVDQWSLEDLKGWTLHAVKP